MGVYTVFIESKTGNVMADAMKLVNFGFDLVRIKRWV